MASLSEESVKNLTFFFWESNSQPIISSIFDALPHQTGYRVQGDAGCIVNDDDRRERSERKNRGKVFVFFRIVRGE